MVGGAHAPLHVTGTRPELVGMRLVAVTRMKKYWEERLGLSAKTLGPEVRIT